MMLCNNTSRYDVAIAAIRGGAQVNPKVAVDAHTEISGLRHEAQKARDYVLEHGKGKKTLLCSVSGMNHLVLNVAAHRSRRHVRHAYFQLGFLGGETKRSGYRTIFNIESICNM